jgi:hypothetical protein
MRAILELGQRCTDIPQQRTGCQCQVTDVDAVREKIAELGEENVVCVLSTTSCFAPRTPDNVVELVRRVSCHPPHRWRAAERRHPAGRERMGSPTQQTT